jgi:hypothetical protein
VLYVKFVAVLFVSADVSLLSLVHTVCGSLALDNVGLESVLCLLISAVMCNNLFLGIG